jgi:hypothetical protein
MVADAKKRDREARGANSFRPARACAGFEWPRESVGRLRSRSATKFGRARSSQVRIGAGLVSLGQSQVIAMK